MQDHEVRASDLNRKLIFSFFLLFSLSKLLKHNKQEPKFTVQQSHLISRLLVSNYNYSNIAIFWRLFGFDFKFLQFPSVKFLKIWQRSYSLSAFLAFNLSKKFVRQGFRLAKKHEKTALTTPTFFDFKSFFLPDSSRFEQIRKFYRRKFKKFEIKANQTSKNDDVWVVLIWD